MLDRRIEYLPLDGLMPASRNPKRHAPAQLRASIERFGYASPALRDERTGRLVVGHGRTEALTALRDAGQDPPSGVRVDGTGRWLVPVVCGWASRSDAEAEAYLVADNRHTELGGWDHQELADLLNEVSAVDPTLLDVTGWDPDELDAILAEEGSGQVTHLPAGDPDDVPEPPSRPVSQPGDLWRLGPHRLLVGDATNPDDLDRLTAGAVPGIVYTDPPYGISIVKGGQVGVAGPFGGKAKGRVGVSVIVPATDYLPVAGDETTQAATNAFRLLFAEWPGATHVWWGGNHYAASASLPDSPCWLIWDKENDGNTFADAEMAWTNYPGQVRIFRHMWQGMIRASERGKRVHPTQKPVALAVWAFGQVDPKGERLTVLDAFGGSGSTLIAAHQTHRTALVCELEPAYVDVICRRYQEHVGEKPILESTGKPHDFTDGP